MDRPDVLENVVFLRNACCYCFFYSAFQSFG